MKIILNQFISLKKTNEGFFTIRKEFNSDIIPHKGDKIGDPVWKKPYEYEVIEVIIDYNDNICYVTLEAITFDHNNKEVLKEWFEIVKLHDWETIGEIY